MSASRTGHFALATILMLGQNIPASFQQHYKPSVESLSTSRQNFVVYVLKARLNGKGIEAIVLKLLLLI